ncbi:MAG TPA: right-handed parallel beta-helix repeat-containing protein, partial [Bacteroidota bacterium]|nr:right-handed parallel beta-helix repeat-containing protein [Bacteroidota bacterium]
GSSYAPLSDTMKNVWPLQIGHHVYVNIFEEIQVASGAHLVIQPGVIVKMQYQAFDIYGTVNAQGTIANPIIFTSWHDNAISGKTTPVSDTTHVSPADWYFFALRNGSGPSVVRYCQFYYGGRDGQQAVFLDQNLSTVVFSNNLIRKSSSGGIVINNTAFVIDSTQVDSCGSWGIRLYNNAGNNVSVLYCNILYNGQYGMWAQSPSSFSVVTGCNISHNASTGLYTENNQVPLSVQGNIASWNGGHGIYVIANNDAVDTLININGNVVRNNAVVGIVSSRAIVSDDSVTGNRYGFGVTGEISLTGKSTENGNVYISNVSSGNTFEGILMAEATLYGVLGGSYPAGYTSKVIAIRGDVTVPSGQTLSIVPGTIVKFPVEWGSGTFDCQGVLKSEGTASKKIVFTSWYDDTYGGDSNADSNHTVPGPGNWDRIYLDNGGSSNSHILNTIVRYAGRTGNGNLGVYNNNAPVDTSFFSFGQYYGVYFNNSTSTITACDIHDNNYDGILVQGSLVPTIQYNNIYNNGRYGLNNNTGTTTSAANNYWGAQSGPLVNQGSDQNLTGTGNQVYLNPGAVTYRPFFTTRSGILVGDVSQNGTITAFDAAEVLQAVVGDITLSGSQQLAADVTGDGTVSALDASYILQFVVGLITGFPGSGKTVGVGASAFDVRIDRGTDVNSYIATLHVKDATNVLANELRFSFDPTLVTPTSVTTTDLTKGMTLQYSFKKTGEARIALAGTKPIDHAAGDVVRLVFTMKNTPAARYQSPLKITKFMANEVNLTSQIQITDNAKLVPQSFALMQNYPNPFNPSTQIEYQLPVGGTVRLTIYDSKGQEVRTLVNENQDAGYYKAIWDGLNAAGNSVSSGVYYYRIDAMGAHQSYNLVKKMLLVK